jgi:hypothetical protein
MGTGFQLILSSVAASVFLTRVTPEYVPFQSYVANFGIFLALQFSAYFIYTVFLWPNYLSPLRKLPGPKVRTVADWEGIVSNACRMDRQSMVIFGKFKRTQVACR